MPDITYFFKKIILLNLMGRCLKDGDRKLQGGSFKRIPASQKTKIVLSSIIILFAISYFPCKVILATKIIKIVKALKYPYYIKCLVKKCFLNKNKKKLLPANNDISF